VVSPMACRSVSPDFAEEDDVGELRVFAQGDIGIASRRLGDPTDREVTDHASLVPEGTEPQKGCGNFDPIKRNLSRATFVVSFATFRRKMTTSGGRRDPRKQKIPPAAAGGKW